MFVTALLLALQVQADPMASAKPAPDPAKLICRRETDTGSVMAKKVCHTRADWARISGQNEDRMNRSGANTQGNGRPPSGS